MDERDTLEFGRDARGTIAVLKGSTEYAQWVDQLSRDTRLPRAVLLDLALSEWAQQRGHPAPPGRL